MAQLSTRKRTDNRFILAKNRTLIPKHIKNIHLFTFLGLCKKNTLNYKAIIFYFRAATTDHLGWAVSIKFVYDNVHRETSQWQMISTLSQLLAVS